MPKTPEVYADKRSKIIVKAGGKLIIDGDPQNTAGQFDPENMYLSRDTMINIIPSGLDTRLAAGGSPETVYQFDGENNWGGIYFEAGFNGDSLIKRARISGAYDGIVVVGAGNSSEGTLKILDSIIASNYIGVHVDGNGKLSLINGAVDSNMEYGIKTEGDAYAVDLDKIVKVGKPNRLADYYSAKLGRRLRFNQILENQEIASGESK